MDETQIVGKLKAPTPDLLIKDAFENATLPHSSEITEWPNEFRTGRDGQTITLTFATPELWDKFCNTQARIVMGTLFSLLEMIGPGEFYLMDVSEMVDAELEGVINQTPSGIILPN